MNLLSIARLLFSLTLLALIAAGCGESPPPARPQDVPASPSATEPSATGQGRARLEPARGAYLGVSLNWGEDTAIAFAGRLGAPAAVYVQFVHFPLTPGDRANLDGFIEQVAGQRGLALITLEPHGGLETVTPAAAADLAELLAGYNGAGVPTFVRFAHEMNGSWYVWSQKPAAYISAFRRVAEAVHRRAPASAMLWAPNHGAGYPFVGGQYVAQPGAADLAALDTNGDGRLDGRDDPYAPYYPGDDAVDWVGMSIYHWGHQYPWGENEVPAEGKFIGQITGVGAAGDERALPDFYAAYVQGRGKPMAVTETAALYNPAADGPDARTIKQAWWRQVFSPAVARDYPGIKMINWFEWRKFEREINGVVDWTATLDPALARAFRDDLLGGHWLFATDLPALASGGPSR